MNMHRLEHILMLLAGTALLVVGGLSLVLPADTRALNRLPAERPELSIPGLLSPQTREAWSDYLADKLAVAGLGRRANASLERSLFNDAVTRTVIRGDEGWLYFAPAIAALLPGDPTRSDEAIDGIVGALSQLERAGLDARFAIAPHKPAQYPQFLPDQDQRMIEAASSFRDTLRLRFEAELGSRWIDTFDAMARSIKQEPDVLHYLREDTHWSDRGAAVMAEAVVQSFGDISWDGNALSATGPQPYRPDLLQMEGGQQGGFREGYVVQRDGVTVERVLSEGETGWQRRYLTTSQSAPLGGRLVLIGDSYSVALAPLMAPYFEEVVWVRLRDFNPEAAGPVITSADHALILIVERHTLENAPLGPAGLDQLISQALNTTTG